MDGLMGRIKAMTEEIQDLNDTASLFEKRKKATIDQLRKDFKDKEIELTKEFQKYRDYADNEMEIKHLSLEELSTNFAQIKKELKITKALLMYPRLREKHRGYDFKEMDFQDVLKMMKSVSKELKTEMAARKIMQEESSSEEENVEEMQKKVKKETVFST